MALNLLGSFSSYAENGIPVAFQVKTDLQGGSVLDYVEVFYDDSSNSLRIFWWYFIDDRTAGNPGEELFSATPPHTDAITENVYSSYKFCQGSNLVRFKSSKVFPFFYQETTNNHYLCEIVVCDLVLNEPSVIDATEDEAGTIEITSSSSHGPVEYKLNSDFTYGFGNTTGVFENLIPGDYTIYARDSKGCKATKNVKVELGNTYGLKYFSEYYDIDGGLTLINIYKRNYSGGFSEVKSAGNPLIINWGKRGEVKHHPIKGSEAIISFISETDYQFLEFFTEGSQDYIVTIYKDGAIIWKGFITPELYSEPYKEVPYSISLTATDGLGYLKDIDFGYYTYSPSEFDPSVIVRTFNKYSGRMRQLNVIHLCIKKLGLDLSYYTGVAVYEYDMSTVDPYDPLYHIHVNVDNYYTNGVMNCYDVLMEQLKPYGARIYQANNHWNIIKFDQQVAPYPRYRYTSDALYFSKETFNPIVNILSPDSSSSNIWVQNNMNLEIKPGYNIIEASHDLGYVENLIRGGNFDVKDFNEDGILKYFSSYNNLIYLSPIIYESKALQVTDTSVNNGLNITTLNTFNVIKVKSHSNVNVILTGEQSVGGISCFENDIVSLSGQFLNNQNGVWVVKKETWIRDTRLDSTNNFKAFIYEVLVSFGNFAGYKYSISVPSNFVLGGPSNSTGAISLNQISDFFINSFAYIQTQPVNVEYDANDQFVIQINRKSVSLETCFLGLEIKLGNYYLSDDLFFKEYYNFIEVELDNSGKFTIDEIIGDVGPLEGPSDLTIKFWWYRRNSYAPGNYSLIFDWMKAIYMPDGFDPEKSKLYSRTNSNKYRHVPDIIDVMHGDAPSVLNKDKIYSTYFTLENGVPTQNWFRKDFNESKNLLKLLLESIMSNNLRSNQLISGTIKQLLSLSNCIFDPSNPNRVFMIGSLQYDDKMAESTVELLELSTSGGGLVSFSSGFTIGFGGAFD